MIQPRLFLLFTSRYENGLLSFKGKLRVGPTGQVELKLTMDGIWENPFGLKYLAFGNMILAVGIQPGVPVPMLGMIIYFDAVRFVLIQFD